MVRIRLRRMGAKKRPFYRVVVADARSPREGRFVEEIGYYDPTKDPAVVKIDQERAIHWILQGAQPTDTARSLLRQAGVLQRVHEIKAERRAARRAAEASAPQAAEG